jgi:uncharacterized protein
MTDLWAALGLMLALEGALYALFPTGMRRMLLELLAQPSPRVRATGVLACAAGVGIVWLARR